jgi:hypothetical protein
MILRVLNLMVLCNCSALWCCKPPCWLLTPPPPLCVCELPQPPVGTRRRKKWHSSRNKWRDARTWRCAFKLSGASFDCNATTPQPHLRCIWCAHLAASLFSYGARRAIKFSIYARVGQLIDNNARHLYCYCSGECTARRLFYSCYLLFNQQQVMYHRGVNCWYINLMLVGEKRLLAARTSCGQQGRNKGVVR